MNMRKRRGSGAASGGALAVAMAVAGAGAGCSNECPREQYQYMGRCWVQCTDDLRYLCDSMGNRADAGPYFDAPGPEAGDAGDDAADAGDAGEGGDADDGGDGGNAVAPPRPIAPLSTATVTSQQPIFKWALPAGVAGARLEVCRDRALTMECARAEVDGTTAIAPRMLAPGVWFWRLRGRDAGVTGTRTSPVWQFYVGARSAPVNTSWGTVLDVNGDGYRDVAVGAWGVDTLTGLVEVYHGSPSGLVRTPARVIVGPDGRDGSFGLRVVSAGDVNGDGFGDLLVGAPGGVMGAGRVHVYFGSATGVGAMPDVSVSGLDGANGQFGAHLAGVGDANGDGYADIVVGTNSKMLHPNRAYVFLGSADGLETTRPARFEGPEQPDIVQTSWLSAAGDTNGDGYGDLVIARLATPVEPGALRVYLGSTAGLRSFMPSEIPAPSASDDRFGNRVDGAGDVNGDGYADVVATAYRAGEQRGLAHVFAGGAAGVAATPAATLSAAPGSNVQFVAIEVAGDVNGDGFSDVALAGSAGMGRVNVLVHHGAAGGPGTTAAATLNPPEMMGTSFGYATTTAGDINGDGFADLVTGDLGYASNAGRAYVFPGAMSGVAATPTITLVNARGMNSFFGGSIAVSRPRVGRSNQQCARRVVASP